MVALKKEAPCQESWSQNSDLGRKSHPIFKIGEVASEVLLTRPRCPSVKVWCQSDYPVSRTAHASSISDTWLFFSGRMVQGHVRKHSSFWRASLNLPKKEWTSERKNSRLKKRTGTQFRSRRWHEGRIDGGSDSSRAAHGFLCFPTSLSPHPSSWSYDAFWCVNFGWRMLILRLKPKVLSEMPGFYSQLIVALCKRCTWQRVRCCSLGLFDAVLKIELVNESGNFLACVVSLR